MNVRAKVTEKHYMVSQIPFGETFEHKEHIYQRCFLSDKAKSFMDWELLGEAPTLVPVVQLHTGAIEFMTDSTMVIRKDSEVLVEPHDDGSNS